MRQGGPEKSASLSNWWSPQVWGLVASHPSRGSNPTWRSGNDLPGVENELEGDSLNYRKPQGMVHGTHLFAKNQLADEGHRLQPRFKSWLELGPQQKKSMFCLVVAN